MLSGNRVAMLVEEGFEDSELVGPMQALKDAGAKVILIGSGSQRSYKGKRNTVHVKPNANADEVSATDFDAVIIPGGNAPDKMRLHGAMVDMVREAYESGKIVAAICHGPQLLISADILRGRRATSWPSVAVDLRNAGAEWVDEPVVQDNNIITARKPADIPRFNKVIIEALKGHYAKGSSG
ncbi:MAG: type 1 glutamine amidotransferase domain-containing protein [Dehalococcoidia bacterium]